MKLDFGSFWRWGSEGPGSSGPGSGHPQSSAAAFERRGGILERLRGGRSADERRRENRTPVSGAIVAFWTVDGVAVRARGELVDAGETGAGLGALLRKEPPIGASAWILTEDGQVLASVTRHAQAAGGGLYRAGLYLDLEELETAGWGGAKLRWIDEESKIHVSPASLRNASEGLLEASCVESLPVGALTFVGGGERGCIAIVRSCETYGERRLVKLETLTDAIEQRRSAAA